MRPKPGPKFVSVPKVSPHRRKRPPIGLFGKCPIPNLPAKAWPCSVSVCSTVEISRRRIEEEAERILAEANATAERIRNDAQVAADQELRRAQRRLREEAADIALDLAGTILREQATDADRERLMDEFITRVEPAGREA